MSKPLGKYHYEFIEERRKGHQWRVGNQDDDMVADFGTEAEAKQFVENHKSSLEVVASLIMEICESFADQNTVNKLRTHGRYHASDCGLGSIPTCTCGQQEAQNFLRLYDGEIRGSELLR